jgi:hypothetical protein
MDLNKAIRKQKKSYKRFMLSMCFIFFVLPAILYLENIRTTFFISYMVLIQALIVMACIIRTDSEHLKFELVEGKFNIKNGFFRRFYNIQCDKVVIVHFEKNKELIIVTNSKFRNKAIKKINKDFLFKYSLVSHEYIKIKKMYPEEDYYFITLDKGSHKLYKLLISLYKNSVKAVYTDEAIETIKQWL